MRHDRGARRAFLALVALVAALFPMGVARAAPQIEFLNPSDYTTTLTLSDQQDGDVTYHVSAWVQDVPSAPIVEFEIQPAAGQATTLDATRVGTDTWEANVSLSAFPDGAYTLRAILYGGQTEVDSVEKTVTINRQDVPPPTAAETVEIAHPSNGESLGFFTPKGKRAVTVLDGLASEGAQQVRAFYTLSDPGSDPEWVACGSGSVGTGGSVRVKCSLEEGAKATDVSAVAMVANQTPPPAPPQGQADQTGDAHRVIPYTAVPSELTLSPSSFTATPGECQPFALSVLDQNGRPLPDANVDLHGVGPDDQLRFGTIANTTSGYQNPDTGHISDEPAIDCAEKDAATQRQGDHNSPGLDDQKHIESTTGTNTNGVFSFALYSASVGGMEIVAWADIDDDDTRDGSEPGRGGAVGWGEPPPVANPAVTLEPASTSSAVGSCVRFEVAARRGGDNLAGANLDIHLTGPDANVTFCDPGGGSLLRDPDSGGHVGGSHEDGTRHREGEADGAGNLVFGVTSATEGSTQVFVWYDSSDDDIQGGGEPGDSAGVSWQPSGERSISISSNRTSVRKGRTVRISGSIEGTDACSDAQTVKLKAKKSGRKFRTLSSTATDSEGAYLFTVTVKATKTYKAVTPASGVCVKAKSSTITIRAT